MRRATTPTNANELFRPAAPLGSWVSWGAPDAVAFAEVELAAATPEAEADAAAAVVEAPLGFATDEVLVDLVAKAEAEKARPGLNMYTDESRLDDGAAGYAVVWKNGQSRVGIKNPHGLQPRGLRRRMCRPRKGAGIGFEKTDYAGAGRDPHRRPATIRRMASEAPGPGQQYALQARKHIAMLRRARPGITIENQCCPTHKGIAGNEKADEWAKIAAEEPDTRGVEWLN